MAGMSWEQYYDGFYEWSSGTQIRYLARLDGYGSGAQTAEIAAELAEAGDGGPAAAKRLIMRAVENGVRFTAEDVIEMAGADIEEDTLKYALATVREPLTGSQIVTLSDYFDEDALSKAVRSAKEPFTPEQVTELIDYVDDGALSKAVKNTKGQFTKAQREELEDSGFCFSNGIFEDTDSGKESRETVHEFGGGCLLGLLGIFLGSSKKEDGSSCHDSAPHYGYRYGRWYYGNDHSYGCENEKKKK